MADEYILVNVMFSYSDDVLIHKISIIHSLVITKEKIEFILVGYISLLCFKALLRLNAHITGTVVL